MSDYDAGVLDFKDLKLGETSTLHVCIKQFDGKMFIDARKWIKYPNCDELRSSKKGLMIDADTWSQLIPIVQGFIKDISTRK